MLVNKDYQCTDEPDDANCTECSTTTAPETEKNPAASVFCTLLIYKTFKYFIIIIVTIIIIVENL